MIDIRVTVSTSGMDISISSLSQKLRPAKLSVPGA